MNLVNILLYLQWIRMETNDNKYLWIGALDFGLIDFCGLFVKKYKYWLQMKV
jgi:hypothetical protein